MVATWIKHLTKKIPEIKKLPAKTKSGE